MQARHEPVARPGAQRRPEVEAAADADQRDAREQQRHARDRRVRACGERERDVDRDAHDDDVADRPQPGPLAQRDPAQEDDQADEDRRRADREPGLAVHAVGQDRPGRVPQRRRDDEPLARPEEPQPGQQAGQAPGRGPPGAHAGPELAQRQRAGHERHERQPAAGVGRPAHADHVAHARARAARAGAASPAARAGASP